MYYTRFIIFEKKKKGFFIYYGPTKVQNGEQNFKAVTWRHHYFYSIRNHRFLCLRFKNRNDWRHIWLVWLITIASYVYFGSFSIQTCFWKETLWFFSNWIITCSCKIYCFTYCSYQYDHKQHYSFTSRWTHSWCHKRSYIWSFSLRVLHNYVPCASLS